DPVAHVDDHGVAHVVDVLDQVAQHPAAQATLEVGDQRVVVGVDHVEGDLQAPVVDLLLRRDRPGPVPHVDDHGLAHVVDVVDLVVHHRATQPTLEVGDQHRVIVTYHI